MEEKELVYTNTQARDEDGYTRTHSTADVVLGDNYHIREHRIEVKPRVPEVVSTVWGRNQFMVYSPEQPPPRRRKWVV